MTNDKDFNQRFRENMEEKGSEAAKKWNAKLTEDRLLYMERSRASWGKEGVNYWENPDCPHHYLVMALQDLILFVEDTSVNYEELSSLPREELIEQVERYEYFADK